MGRVPIVSVVRGRDTHSRLGLRIRGCRHIALLAHDENIIPKKSYCRITCSARSAPRAAAAESLWVASATSGARARARAGPARSRGAPWRGRGRTSHCGLAPLSGSFPLSFSFARPRLLQFVKDPPEPVAGDLGGVRRARSGFNRWH